MSGPDAIEVAAERLRRLPVDDSPGRGGAVNVALEAWADAADLDPDADGSVVLTRRTGEWEVAGRLEQVGWWLDAYRFGGIAGPSNGGDPAYRLVPPVPEEGDR